MWALQGQEIELDEQLAMAFQLIKKATIETEERQVIRTRRK